MEDNEQPSQRQSSVDASTHDDAGKARGGKRVGFLSAGQRRASYDDTSRPAERRNRPPSALAEHNRRSHRDGSDNDFTAELERNLQHEHHAGSLASPKRVLQKHAAVETSPEPDDENDSPQRSAAAARDRAYRLAESLYDGPSDAGTRALPGPDGSPAIGQHAGDALPGEPSRDALMRTTLQTNRQVYDGLRARKGAEKTASDLVRAFSQRNRASLHSPERREHRGEESRDGSGNATPVAHDLDYVPRPSDYHSGILGTLLKLYNEDQRGAGSSGNSPFSTPERTPQGSPPTSRPGTPKPARPRSGLFSLKGHHSASSVTLGNLIQASSKLAAPGSADIGGAVTEKIHQDQIAKPKKRRRRTRVSKLEDEIRITVHIAEMMQRHRYLVKLCRALMLYGAPTHRLEAYMAMSARVLAIEGQFLYMPGFMLITFDDSSTHTAEVKVVRAPQGVDLGRLHEVHEVYKAVVHDLMGVEEATAELEDIMGRRPRYPDWVRVAVYGLASACVAPFAFEGRWIDLPPAFALGCLLGVLQLLLAPSNELYANVFEITAAVLTSFLARALGSIRQGNLFCFSALAQASIALILPGYMVLLSSLELQSHAMLAGSVRLVYSMIYTLFLGYGITIGTALYGYIDRNATSNTSCDQPLDSRWYFLFVPLFAICLCVINQAKWPQTPVMLLLAIAGYGVSSYSGRFFAGSSQVSGSLGALTIGVLANLYSRLGRHVENFGLDIWENWIDPGFRKVQLRARKLKRLGRARSSHGDSEADAHRMDSWQGGGGEERAEEGRSPAGKEPEPQRRVRKVGYGLAAAAMLPAIFVQVPGGLAVNGSLLSGITSANQITHNTTTTATGINDTAFSVLFSVIQVAISISVGLSLSALIVYPFGKRRSGLLSF